MNTSQPLHPESFDLERFIMQFITAIGTGIVGFIALISFLALAFNVFFIGRVFPGVQVHGIDVGGVPRGQLADYLAERIDYQNSVSITLTDEGQAWTFAPAQLGITLDVDATAEQAYRYGRTGWPLRRWHEKLSGLSAAAPIAPQLVLDGLTAQNTLSTLAAEVNQPTQEAELSVNGLDVQVTPGQVGRSLDAFATIALLESQLHTLSSIEQALLVVETPPLILDASAQADLARAILSQPLVITSGDGENGPWRFEPETLATMLKIERVPTETGATFQVGLDRGMLYATIAPLSSTLTREPINARFIFNDDTRELEVIEQAVIGRELLVEDSIDHINQELAAGRHQIELQYATTDPEVTSNATAAQLGITELVSQETTYFYGSSSGRIQNIQTAGARFHGLLVAPGETFSMVENIGDISLETGFAEALIIYGDRTIAGVGGGVCQVSTTLFRTVFFGGFPIVERYSHSYRVYYYELAASGAVNPNLAGLDATVYAPLVDFKFTNDTDSWLLMEVYVDPAARSITWKFYSTSDGRDVDWTTSGLQNKVEPPLPLYEENDELAKGEIEQVDWAVEGADVYVTRTVMRDGQVLHYDEINTHYTPWRTICEYGPNTNNYPPSENKQDKYGCGVKGN